jgi:hypothetical protein
MVSLTRMVDRRALQCCTKTSGAATSDEDDGGGHDLGVDDEYWEDVVGFASI